jgi:UDP-GlcNAc3NAcA epimerase
VIREKKPDLVLVYGDTNSTLAGTLAASKLLVPVAHVEAGLRSRSKRMPEEQNRIVADHLSTWLLCPTDTAVRNLTAEGIVDGDHATPSSDAPAVKNVGDIMLDASMHYRGLAARRPDEERALARLGLKGPFRLLTLHRAENTDDPARLKAIMSALAAADSVPILFPVHPRTRKRLEAEGISVPATVRMIDPVGYFDMVELEEACSAVLTDSGGVQKEAYFFGKPCITLRDETEWVETVEAGWNTIVGADPDRIAAALSRLDTYPSARPALYGEGRAAELIAGSVLG